MLKPNWFEIERIINNPDQDFVCVQQDLQGSLEKHKASFRAQDEVQRILRDPQLMSEIYIIMKEGAAPPGTPLNLPDDPRERLVEVRRRISKHILVQARRLRERKAKQRQRQSSVLSLHAPTKTEEGEVSLEETIEGDVGIPLSLDMILNQMALTKEKRQMLRLRYEGFTHEEIAKKVGRHQSTIGCWLKELRETMG